MAGDSRCREQRLGADGQGQLSHIPPELAAWHAVSAWNRSLACWRPPGRGLSGSGRPQPVAEPRAPAPERWRTVGEAGPAGLLPRSGGQAIRKRLVTSRCGPRPLRAPQGGGNVTRDLQAVIRYLELVTASRAHDLAQCGSRPLPINSMRARCWRNACRTSGTSRMGVRQIPGTWPAAATGSARVLMHQTVKARQCHAVHRVESDPAPFDCVKVVLRQPRRGIMTVRSQTCPAPGSGRRRRRRSSLPWPFLVPWQSKPGDEGHLGRRMVPFAPGPSSAGNANGASCSRRAARVRVVARSAEHPADVAT